MSVDDSSLKARKPKLSLHSCCAGPKWSLRFLREIARPVPSILGLSGLNIKTFKTLEHPIATISQLID